MIALLLILQAIVPSSSARAAAKGQGPVILVVADYLTLDDLEKAHLANIDRLLAKGSIGLISPSASGRKSEGGVYASVGAGTYLKGADAIDEAYSVDEVLVSEEDAAAQVYARRTGISAPTSGVVNLGFSAVARANEPQRREGSVGLLGMALRKAGKKVAVFGNSDIDQRFRRPGAGIAMDERGRIPEGDVSVRMLHREPLSATGWVTDIEAVKRSVAGSDADVIVVEFGDTARNALCRDDLTVRAYERYNKEALHRLDQLLGGLMQDARSRNGKLIFASLIPPEINKRPWMVLTPVAAFIPGGAPGLLFSPTTRRPGLIAGVDIAPTILDLSHVDVPPEMLGRAIEYKKTLQPLTTLRYLDRMTRENNLLQWPVLSVAAVLGGLIVTLATLAVAFGWKLSRTNRSILRAGLVLAFSLLGGLLFTGVGASPVAGIVLGTLGIFLAGYAVAFGTGALVKSGSLANKALPLVSVFLVVSAVIVVDALTGAKLVGSSVASYHFTAGFRFYGIGNEYMGVLIGAVFASMLWIGVSSDTKELRRGQKAVILLVFTAVAVILGWPGLGANAGGAIAAVVTFGLGYRALSSGQIRLRDVLGLIGASIALLLVVAFLDITFSRGASSHIGFAAATVNREGPLSAFETMIRKALMNLSLIATRQSRTAIIGFIPFFALWFGCVQKRVRRLFGIYPRLRSGLIAGMIGAAVAFVFNDSGVISAAIMVAAVVCSLLYTLLGEEACRAADNGS